MNRIHYQPLGGNQMPRFGGPATMMRLPSRPDASGLDACFVGVPFDIGTSNRAGARFGPRQIRAESCLIRPYNMATRAAPFDSLSVADIGDVAINTFNLTRSMAIIEQAYDGILATGCKPLTLGGDHTIALPILRALTRRYGPVGMVHVDAHADINEHMFGEPVAHGTPFRRAVEEGLLDPKRVVQIGIRGSAYDGEDTEFARSVGVRIIFIEELMERGTKAVMDEAKSILGTGPTYLSFDIDGVDPAQAPGTGTPEIGGFSTFQAQQMLRQLGDVDLVGADFVELSPPFDVGGITAWAGASLVFEILCVLAQSVQRRG